MEIKEKTSEKSSDFNCGYEKGYHSKDYTWEDGIDFISAQLKPESKEYKEGYAEGQRDRIRDEMQKFLC